MEFSKIGEKIGSKLDKALTEVEKAMESVSETLTNALKESEIKTPEVTISLKDGNVIITGDVDSITFNDKIFFKKQSE